ncbi:M15 family metallopeptidase [Aquabacterium sp. A7-Y]|uniref:M15 family metallopeptidase n=1 Tax=Aquabacterium sp. A7-Y TaxID=1349605 RepID=UPI00223D59BF|nr:M15 family metallopeptidase [Aquabacterium sp. A7-Y]MCW7541553.1 M15 family metallopeptidase [Aquabacterium sp. A7-Y]
MPRRLRALAEELGIPPSLPAERGLQVFEEAGALAVAEVSEQGREFLLVPAAAAAWQRMKAMAAADGVVLYLVSAFRSIERQADIIRRKLHAGASIESILAVNAPPGYSEHHSGRAVDVATPGSPPLETAFETTAAFGWLARHAEVHGFTLSYPRGNAGGYLYEPWHWCYVASGDGCA